jgi:hypothetical protein
MSGAGGRAGLLEYVWVAGFAIAGLLLAAFTSEELCGSTDGSFALDDPLAAPSDYCKAAHMPGVPDSVGSWLLIGGIYLGPSVIALAGVLIADRTRRLGFKRWGFALATALFLAAVFFSAASANVGYDAHRGV